MLAFTPRPRTLLGSKPWRQAGAVPALPYHNSRQAQAAGRVMCIALRLAMPHPALDRLHPVQGDSPQDGTHRPAQGDASHRCWAIQLALCWATSHTLRQRYRQVQAGNYCQVQAGNYHLAQACPPLTVAMWTLGLFCLKKR